MTKHGSENFTGNIIWKNTINLDIVLSQNLEITTIVHAQKKEAFDKGWHFESDPKKMLKS